MVHDRLKQRTMGLWSVGEEVECGNDGEKRPRKLCHEKWFRSLEK
jgi:hypothetical protein